MADVVDGLSWIAGAITTLKNALVDFDNTSHLDMQILQNNLNSLHSDLQNIHNDLQLMQTSINNKELTVSNETIVEAPLSTYVSKGALEFNDV